jgi:hypothetical protein|tara:strand:- start:4395 stop:5255 length:861 start_codon:yes stop_codon:yes gene_type:complete
MTWLKIESGLMRHPKVGWLSKALGVNRNETVGLLVHLWAWCLDYAEDGELSKYTSDDIAFHLGYNQQAALIQTDIMQALIDTGFVDQDGDRLTLHDWSDHQGSLIAAREKNRERQRRYAARKREVEAPNASANASPTGAIKNTKNIIETKKDRPAHALAFKDLEPVTHDMVLRWEELFPELNISAELESMRVYLDASPPSKLPKRALGRFAINWLKRSNTENEQRDRDAAAQKKRSEREQDEMRKFMADVQARGGPSKVAIEEAKQYMHQKGFRARMKEKREANRT